MSFIKFNRESKLFDQIIRTRPTAIVLLALIAKRAKRSENHPNKNLEIGECYVGDFDSYGVTRQIYRVDLANLKSTNQVTTKSTNKGTIARIVSTDIFDINTDEANQQTNQPTNPKSTTNNKYKNIYSHPEYLVNLPPDDISSLSSKYKLSTAEITTQAEQASLWLQENGKAKKDYRAFLHRWLAKSKTFTAGTKQPPQGTFARLMEKGGHHEQ